MTDGTTMSAMKALRRSPWRALLKAAAAFFLCLSVPAPLFVAPLSAGEALAALNRAASPAEPPAVPAVRPAAEPAVSGSAVRPLKVYFINVGQGDSEYIELPNGGNVLIDGGPSKSSHSLLARFMTMHNVTRIDHVVLTHPHSDHYSGLHYVFGNFTVGRFYDTKMDNTASITDDLLREQVAGSGVGVTYPAPGDVLDWDPAVQARVFNSCPEPVQSAYADNLNNCSIVVKLSYSGSSVLFTGDIESGAEARLVSRYGDELRAEALKIGHHGSRNSTSDVFLKTVKPREAYISVGKNSYGHPTQVVLDRLKAAGAVVRRTDTDGTQELSFGAPSAEAGAEAGTLAYAQ